MAAYSPAVRLSRSGATAPVATTDMSSAVCGEWVVVTRLVTQLLVPTCKLQLPAQLAMPQKNVTVRV
jgi:hypothetical protein